MWLRYLVGHLAQQAAAQKVKASVGEALRDALSPSTPRSDEPCDILFVFALNAESGALADMLEGSVYTKSPNFVERSGLLVGRQVVVAEVGVGAKAAARGTEDAISIHRPKWVVSAGFAGGLVDGLRKGHLVVPGVIQDANGASITTALQLDTKSLGAGTHVGRLITLDQLVRTPEAKRDWASKSGAIICDMESFAVAQVCQRHGVPLVSVRIVSDTVDDLLPIEIEKLLMEPSWAGKLGTITGAIFNRFSVVSDMWQLYEDALKCSKRLAKFLVATGSQLPLGEVQS